jgi:hypothetical protein
MENLKKNVSLQPDWEFTCMLCNPNVAGAIQMVAKWRSSAARKGKPAIDAACPPHTSLRIRRMKQSSVPAWIASSCGFARQFELHRM